MKSKLKIGLGLSLIVALSACSKDKDAAPAPNAIASAINVVSQKVQQANIADYSSVNSVSSKAFQSGVVVPYVAPGSLASATWNNTGDAMPVNNLYCGGGACSPMNYALKDWVHDMMSPTFKNSNGATVGLMGRFTSAVGFACQIGQLLGGGSQLPAATTSTQTITVTLPVMNAAAVICDQPTQDSFGEDGATTITVNYDITDITGAFDKKFHFVSDGFDQYLYIKISADLYSVLSTEQNPDRPTHYNRYYASYTPSTGEARFEGLEKGFPVTSTGDDAQAGFYFYRVYVNDTTKNISVLGQNGGIQCTADNGTTCTTMTQSNNRTLVGGTGNTEVALASLGFYVGNGATTYYANAENSVGCIDMTSGTFSTAGSCTDYPLTNLATAEAMINAGNGISGTSAYSLPRASWKSDETISELAFDGATIFSLPPTN